MQEVRSEVDGGACQRSRRILAVHGRALGTLTLARLSATRWFSHYCLADSTMIAMALVASCGEE